MQSKERALSRVPLVITSSCFSRFFQVVKCYMRAFPDQINNYTTVACGKHEKKCERLCLYISGGKCIFSLEVTDLKWDNFLETESLTSIYLSFCSRMQDKPPWVYKHGLQPIFVHLFACCHFLLHIYFMFSLYLGGISFLWCLFGSLPSGFGFI